MTIGQQKINTEYKMSLNQGQYILKRLAVEKDIRLYIDITLTFGYHEYHKSNRIIGVIKFSTGDIFTKLYKTPF